MEEKPQEKPVDQPDDSSMTPESNFPATEPTLITPQPFYQNKIIIALAVILLIIIAGLGWYFFNQQAGKTTTSKIAPTPTPGLASKYANKTADFVIAKVGEENIYKKDLDTELAAYPTSIPIDQAIKIILDKMVNDSIILQEGQKEKLITLDKTVYNSLDKDYSKRIKLVEKAKTLLTQNVDNVSGTVASMWFLSTPLSNKPANYETAKEAARQKMTKLQQQVKSGAMTMKQATDSIKADSAWAKYDPNYKGNAELKFNKTAGQKITFDDNFNQALWGLQPGQVSDLYLIQDTTYDTKEKVDALYMFGQVDSKKVSGKNVSFTDWLDGTKKNYAIIYY